MGLIPFPPSDHPEHHPYGNDVALVAGDPGDDVPARIIKTVDAFRGFLEAEFDATSGTTLAERVAQEVFYTDVDGDPPISRAGVQSVQDAPDILADLADLWVYVPTGGDRGVDWPSQAADEAAIMVIFGVMAP